MSGAVSPGLDAAARVLNQAIEWRRVTTKLRTPAEALLWDLTRQLEVHFAAYEGRPLPCLTCLCVHEPGANTECPR